MYSKLCEAKLAKIIDKTLTVALEYAIANICGIQILSIKGPIVIATKVTVIDVNTFGVSKSINCIIYMAADVAIDDC
jgi:hypothetical protein